MKQTIQILSAVLVLTFSALCLTSCTGHQMSQIQGFLNSFSEHTDLVENGKYKPFNVPSNTIEKLMEYTENEDADKIYEAFSPAVKEEAEDLYEKIQEFIRFSENTATSWKYTGGGGGGKNSYGTVYFSMSIFNEFYADSGTYRFDFKDISKNTKQPEMIGISSIMLYPEELGYEYAPKNAPGIYIVYRAEDIPEDISIELFSLEMLMELAGEGNADSISKMFSPTAQRTVDGLEDASAELLDFLNEQVTSWEPFAWTQNRETINHQRVTTQEMFFYLHTDDGLYRCDIREVLERADQENDTGFSSVSIFPALYPGEEPPFEDDVYKEYCTWGRDNMGISIVYQ